MPTAKVKHTNLDKVLFPEESLTKGDLLEHYRAVAGRMLPHLRGRPLAVERYPDGIDGTSIFEQAAPAHTPAWVKRVTVPAEEGEITHLVCQDEATLEYLTDQTAITLHTWLARADKPQRPDQVMFDLDPPPGDFASAREAALALRVLLDELSLPTLVKTSGGRGLHVSVPVARRYDAEVLRDFARSVVAILELRYPDRYTSELRNRREGRLFLDVARNAYAQLIAAPYTVRPNPEARVAVPLAWEELEDVTLRPEHFTIRTMRKRLDDEDPWLARPEPASSLSTARRRIGALRV